MDRPVITGGDGEDEKPESGPVTQPVAGGEPSTSADLPNIADRPAPEPCPMDEIIESDAMREHESKP